jgi:hypothetical protein
MKKTLHNTLAIFILFVSSLIGFSNSNAQTGTLTANPETVTAFTNTNGTGNTYLTWSSSGAAKVLITLQKTRGAQDNGEGIVINNNQLNRSDWLINYIQNTWTHTFRLYATEAGSSALGNLLATVVVTGETAATGTLTASPETVTAFTNANGMGNSTISWSTENSPRTLVTLRRTLEDGTEFSPTTLVIQNNNSSSSVNANYISEGHIHTFTLHTGEAGSSVLGDVLDTVIVYGGATLSTNDEIEIANKTMLTVYPNPSNNLLHIQAKQITNSLLEVRIYDLAGKQVLVNESISGSTLATIDTSLLESGIYILKVVLQNQKVVIQKIVKK